MELAEDDELLEVARQAVEDELTRFRDAHLSQLRNNGLVCQERDGSPSSIIRFGPEHAMRIGLRAIAARLVGASGGKVVKYPRYWNTKDDKFVRWRQLSESSLVEFYSRIHGEWQRSTETVESLSRDEDGCAWVETDAAGNALPQPTRDEDEVECDECGRGFFRDGSRKTCGEGVKVERFEAWREMPPEPGTVPVILRRRCGLAVTAADHDAAMREKDAKLNAACDEVQRLRTYINGLAAEKLRVMEAYTSASPRAERAEATQPSGGSPQQSAYRTDSRSHGFDVNAED